MLASLSDVSEQPGSIPGLRVKPLIVPDEESDGPEPAGW
jgi:hypothetical protein